jgi:hypothetical protein
MNNPTLCLNLRINCHNNIKNLINSVLPYIDTYIIYDKITNHEYIELLKDKLGIVLNIETDIILSDYSLFLESEMTLEINNFNKNILLEGDNFYITKIKDNIEYNEIIIKKNNSLLNNTINISKDNILIKYENNNNINIDHYYVIKLLNSYDKNTNNENIENLYNIINYYKNNNKQKISYLFYLIAKSLMDKYSIHDNRIYYDYTIIAYYNNIININDEIIYILNNSNDKNINTNLLKNMRYYKFILEPCNTIILDETININFNNEEIQLYSSSCSILKQDDNYIANIRYVNYYINDNGYFLNCGKYLVTFNKYVKFDINFNIIESKFFNTEYNGKQYIGIEDIRLFKKNDNIIFIGSQFINNISIVNGIYDINKNILESTELKSTFSDNYCEKNWVYFEDYIIYEWYPLRICKIINNTIETIYLITDLPKIFAYVRGSTCGYKYNNEIWFLTHLVSDESPRFYYNLICVFDITMNLLRYSSPFKLQEQCIEYCLSIIIEDDKIIMSYSIWDRTTRIGIYDKKMIDKILIYK